MAGLLTLDGKPLGAGLSTLAAAIPDYSDRTLRAIALSLKAEMVRLLRTPGQGRFYARGRGKKGTAARKALAGLNGGGAVPKSLAKNLHRASKPGDPPAPDTGTLLRSLFVERDSPTRYRVGTNIFYGYLLEVGSKKVAPRPWLRPAVERIRTKFADLGLGLGLKLPGGL